MFADNAVLVSLSISQWTARKLDKKATNEVAQNHGVKASVGAYNKQILPGSIELKAIQEATGNARTFYYDNTLPWSADGQRILPNSNYFEFTTTMRVLKHEWEQAVTAFEVAYPTLRANAQRELNGLFDPNDYPADVRSKYKFVIDFMPVPQEGDFRIALADEEIEQFRTTLKNVEDKAINDVWRRLYDVVQHASERLSMPDAVFRDTLVENAVAVCDLLPRLNINNDPALEDLRKQVESTLCNKAPEVLRQVPTIRQQTARDLGDIMSKMQAYMGKPTN